MRYVRLGPSGLKVSQICLGTWFLPRSAERDEYGIPKVNLDEFERILKYALDKGLNFIDTANRYHGAMSPVDLPHRGNSEKVLGKLVNKLGREQFVIATKVGLEMAPWPNGKGLSRKHVMWQIRESLRRLQTDYIDVYLTHTVDPETPKLETLRAFNDLICQGKVLYMGLSNTPPEDVIEYMETAREYRLHQPVTIQEGYNILRRDIEKAKVPVARRYGLAVMAYSPLAQGLLSGKYLKGIPEGSRATYFRAFKESIRKESLDKVSRLLEIAMEIDVTLPQLAIAWLLHMQERLGVTVIPIIGATRFEHVQEDLEALDVRLSGEVLKRIDEVVYGQMGY